MVAGISAPVKDISIPVAMPTVPRDSAILPRASTSESSKERLGKPNVCESRSPMKWAEPRSRSHVVNSTESRYASQESTRSESLRPMSPCTLRIEINGVSTLAMIAEESDVTVLDHATAAQVSREPWSDQAVISSITGGRLPARGPVVVSISTGSSVAQLRVYAANIQVGCLLGRDSLVALGIEAREGTARVAPQSDCNRGRVVNGPVHVLLVRRVSLPPTAESIVVGRVPGGPPEGPGGTYLVEPGGLELPAGVRVARSLTHIKGEHVAVRLINGSDRVVHLESGRLVAHLDIAQEVDRPHVPTLRVQSLGLGGTPPSLPAELDALVADAAKDPQFTNDTAERLRRLLAAHESLFAKSDADLGRTDLTVHEIHTESGTAPIRQPPRRPPVALQDENRRILADMLDKGVIEESYSAWASPVVLVKKKDGSLRFCVDYRRLNDITVKDSFPLPRIDATLDSLGGAEWFTTLDLLSGYWQVALSKDAQAKSAFCTPYGLFQWTRMPFGLCNAPATFERLMETVLRGLHWESCLVYLDDVIIFGKTEEQLLQRMDTVFSRLTNAGLKLKPSKCRLFRREVAYLGHIISSAGVRVDPAKITTIMEWPTPKTVRDVRSFAGLASYYRRFVRDFATIAAPLHALGGGDMRHLRWTPEAQVAFDTLKLRLATAPVLAYPDQNAHMILETYASAVGIGATFSQTLQGTERIVAYASGVLSTSQRNYCVTRRELLATVTYVPHFRVHLFGHPFTLRTDGSGLRWLKTQRTPDGLSARWVERLGEFDFILEHRPSPSHLLHKGIARADCPQCFGHKLNHADETELARAESMVGTIRAPLRPQFTYAQLGAHQRADPCLKDLFSSTTGSEPNAISTRTDPPSAPTQALGGALFRNLWPHLEVGRDRILLLVPIKLRRAILDQAHRLLGTTHWGSARMRAWLGTQYHWPGMSDDIDTHVARCSSCSLVVRTAARTPSRAL